MAEGVSPPADALARRVRAGEAAAVARALTRAENGDEPLMQALRPAAGAATVIGITGPPGAGKSTLVSALVRDWRAAGRRVAVLAVDPVSPFSGGALLGDRTRMGEHSLDAGVFIRSVSARGHLGGLSAATHDMVDVIDAAGWDLILLETVGAGQSETEVAEIADLKVVICAPGLGDEVQAIKAGILEIADILVVNKADRPEAERTARELSSMVTLRADAGARNVPVLRTSATGGEGVADLRLRIDAIAEKLRADPHARRVARLRKALADALARRVRSAVRDEPDLEDALEDMLEGRISMNDAVRLAFETARRSLKERG